MPEKKIIVNAAINETVSAFDPQMPVGGRPFGDGGGIPPAVEYLGNGKAVLRFNAPSASAVAVRMGYPGGEKIDMPKSADGVWSTTISSADFGRKNGGYCAVFFEVDGVYALNPMAPIGWSYSHNINIVDVPPEADGTDFYHVKDVPHGTVARDYYYSKVCGCVKSCLVYTPPGYNRGDSADLPVLYLQHGYGENETSWVHLGKINWIMDNLLAEGKAEPCLIVMNNGMVQKEDADGNRSLDPIIIERLLLDDCIPHIESNYRVAADKRRRAMAGLSMGSMQTSFTVLKNPDAFAYAGVFSGFVAPLKALLPIDDYLTALDDKPTVLSAYKLFFRCMGDKDGFLEQYNADSKMLDDKGLSTSAWPARIDKIYDGAHDWNVWRECAADFLSLVFK